MGILNYSVPLEKSWLRATLFFTPFSLISLYKAANCGITDNGQMIIDNKELRYAERTPTGQL